MNKLGEGSIEQLLGIKIMFRKGKQIPSIH